MDWSKFDLAMADPRYLHGVQAVLDSLDDGMSPDDVAKAYRIELRLVKSVKPILFDKNVPYPLLGCFAKHDVRTLRNSGVLGESNWYA